MPSPDLLGLSTILGFGLGLLVTTVIGRTTYLLSHPPRRTYGSAVARGKPGDPSELTPPRPFESWTFESRGKTLHVWDIPCDLPSGPTIILSHGWGDSRIGGLSRVPHLASSCSRLILWDLPGHGESEGSTSLGAREAADLLALIQRIREPNHEIYLYGWSLGAGVSIAAAAATISERTCRIAGVIAEAPYRLPQTPARNVLRERNLPHSWNIPPAFWFLGLEFGVGPTWTRKGPFDRALLASKLTCPLLVIHGEEDLISPPADGLAIAKAAPSGTYFSLPTAGHLGIWTDDSTASQARHAVRAFLSPK